MDEPIGIKQNKLICRYIGQTILHTLSIYNTQRYCPLFQLLFHINITSFIIFKLYNVISKLIIEIFDIFQSRKYNSLKKRYDRFDFECDQIVISIFLLSILSLIMYNTFGYYIFFAGLQLLLISCKILIESIEWLLYDFSLYVNRIVVRKSGELEIDKTSCFDLFKAGVWYACTKKYKKSIFYMILTGDSDIVGF